MLVSTETDKMVITEDTMTSIECNTCATSSSNNMFYREIAFGPLKLPYPY